jgi:hypothetical protein
MHHQSPRPRIPIGVIVILVIMALIPIITVLAWLAWQWVVFSLAYPLAGDVLRFVVFAAPVSFGIGYGYTGLVILWRRYGEREQIRADKVIALTKAQTQIAPLASSFNYHTETIAAPLTLPMDGMD